MSRLPQFVCAHATADDFTTPVRFTISQFSLSRGSLGVGCEPPSEIFDYLTFFPLSPSVADSVIVLPTNCSADCVVQKVVVEDTRLLHPVALVGILFGAVCFGGVIGVVGVVMVTRARRRGVRQPLYDVMAH